MSNKNNTLCASYEQREKLIKIIEELADNSLSITRKISFELRFIFKLRCVESIAINQKHRKTIFFFFQTNESFHIYLFNIAFTTNELSKRYKMVRKLYVETTRPEILGARKCFICFECRWQPKLPGTLPDVSLPLTVIGGYSDSNGIPTSTSDRSPSLLCTHVYSYTGSATPPTPPPPPITCRFVV